MSLQRIPSRYGAFAGFCALISISLIAPLTAGTRLVEDDFPGPLGLKELIAIALKNDPNLVELRGEITIGQAKKVAEKDWRDPELRIARSWENDVELDRPYEERTVERSTDRIGDNNRDQSGSSKESGTRTVTEETVQKVTPGANSDSIQETVTRTERTKGVERKINSKGEGEKLNFNRTETLQRSTDKDVYHGQDPLARDDDYSFRLRIYPPNPKEKKARLKRAQAEINATRAELRTEEREVIAWVRDMYEECQFLKAQIRMAQNEGNTHEPYVKAMKAMEGELFTSGEVAIASLNGMNSKFAVQAAESAYENSRGELAARLGIVEASRIQIYDSLARPAIPLNSHDLEYFIQLAFANRGELAEVISEGQISEAELDVAKSKYMPWFNYFQFEYGINNSGGQQTSDNYGVQFGMSLPFFSWLGHEKAIYEAAVETRYAKMGAIKRRITGEVANAYRAVKSASAVKARAEKEYQSGMADIQKIEAVEAAGKDAIKLQYDAAKAKVKLGEGRLAAQRGYAKALLLFEEAIGSDISEIYHTTVSAAANAYSHKISANMVTSSEAKPAAIATKGDKAAVMAIATKIENQAKKQTAEVTKAADPAPRKKKGILGGLFRKK